MNLALTIRRAIAASGRSQNELAARSGVPQPRISAFVRGGSLRLEAASKLMAALGLEVRAVADRTRQR